MRTLSNCFTVLASALLPKPFWNFPKWMMLSANQQQMVLIVFSVFNEECQKKYVAEVMDKFLDAFILPSELSDDVMLDKDVSNGVWCYSIDILKCFMVTADFKDAVSTGNGDHISILRKQLLIHFFSTPGFNQFAIEMLINILQCEVLLSKAEAHRCKWAATVNWKVGAGKNIEIDLFQENRNCEMKKLIRSMEANKTEKPITRASQAEGGVSKIVDSFKEQ